VEDTRKGSNLKIVLTNFKLLPKSETPTGKSLLSIVLNENDICEYLLKVQDSNTMSYFSLI
jgi:hypothetical protein